MVADKKCARCQEVKSSSVFTKDASRKDGLNKNCKPCANEISLSGYYRAKDRGETWVVEERGPWDRHKITKEVFDQMVQSQGGTCALASCERPAIYIDHDHSCCPGKYSCGECVRGILCQQCNHAEGLLGSDFNKALDMAAYMLSNQNTLRSVE